MALAAAAVLGMLNLIFASADRAPLALSKAWPGFRRSQLWAQIVSDLLVLTAVIYWLGPGCSAAPLMYLFHIILACIVFSPVESLDRRWVAAVFYLRLTMAGLFAW